MTNRCTSIISAYKAPDWIEGRVTNLLEQTEVPNIVAVCQKGSVEDGILAKFPEVIRINTPDIPTVYKAWNLALRCVQTPYVNIANSDDRLVNTAIQEMCDELDSNPEVGMVFTDYYVVYELNGDYDHIESAADGDLFAGCYIGPSPTYRTKLHELYGTYPEEYHVAGDYYMWLNWKVNGVEFKHIEKPMCVWWNRSKNPSIESNLEFRLGNRTVWESARAREFWRNK